MSLCAVGVRTGRSARKKTGASAQRGNVESCNEAVTIVQRVKRLDAARKRKLELKVIGLGCMTLQHGERYVVTRAYG